MPASHCPNLSPLSSSPWPPSSVFPESRMRVADLTLHEASLPVHPDCPALWSPFLCLRIPPSLKKRPTQTFRDGSRLAGCWLSLPGPGPHPFLPGFLGLSLPGFGAPG